MSSKTPDIPTVSVIVPNYNHGRFLKQRIDSVLDQTFQDFELIILDDKSTDNSRDIIETYASNNKITHIEYNEINSGNTFKQWKKGLQIARGKFIWIAESDDYADSQLLTTLMQPFNKHSDLIVSYCQSIIIDDTNNYLMQLDWADSLNADKWKHDYLEDSMRELNQYLSFKNTIPNASAVIFKKPDDANILNDSFDFKMAGDWVFWRKLLNSNGKIAFFAKPYNYFRLHEQSTRAATKEKELNRINEFRRLIIPSLSSPFNDKYDWMVSWWFRSRKVLKGNIQYYIPSLPPTLLFRMFLMYFKNVKKKISQTLVFFN